MPAQVTVDPSQFPEAVRLDLVESLRTRKVNHKFHYDSYKQTQKWLALHQAYSPAVTDPQCNRVYEQSFAAMTQRLQSGRVHLVGLGCGGGRKDTTLLKHLQSQGRSVSYQPCDVSLAMVLVARQTALEVLAAADCRPLVCDLVTAPDLLTPFALSPERNKPVVRLFTFFGMLPNFEPAAILPRLAKLLEPGDHLLLSANLAPGPDYTAGVQKVLPLYDNALTRDWLMTFLADLGVERDDGSVLFEVEENPQPPRLRRILARFHFIRERVLEVHGERFAFHCGEAIQLFFSYRHTPGLVPLILQQHGLSVIDQWVTISGEEGIFLATKSPAV